MNGKLVGYWLLTGLSCLAMGAAGVLNLIRFEGQQEAMRSLGYPVYLMTILGVAKVLGVIALWIPRTPLLKEWAYAGFTFDLLGASASHGFAGHSIPEVMASLVFLTVLVGSCLLRPLSRRVRVETEPENLKPETQS
ncbi:MAG: DoxX family protein [Planctomycetota bacterium]